MKYSKKIRDFICEQEYSMDFAEDFCAACFETNGSDNQAFSSFVSGLELGKEFPEGNFWMITIDDTCYVFLGDSEEEIISHFKHEME